MEGLSVRIRVYPLGGVSFLAVPPVDLSFSSWRAMIAGFFLLIKSLTLLKPARPPMLKEKTCGKTNRNLSTYVYKNIEKRYEKKTQLLLYESNMKFSLCQFAGFFDKSDFWRENSNIFQKKNVARFARNVSKMRFFGTIFNLCDF